MKKLQFFLIIYKNFTLIRTATFACSSYACVSVYALQVQNIVDII